MTGMDRSIRNIAAVHLYERAVMAGQSHIFKYWETLSEEEQRTLINQISRIDFEQLESAIHDYQNAKEDSFPLAPFEGSGLSGDDLLRARKLGEQAIQNGEVCSLVLAGGQGTRLGYPSPKGMYPIGPISGKSLFAWFAEKIQFFNLRYTTHIPWLVMTSQSTEAETRSFFQKEGYFGLGEENVLFFQQALLPNFDFQGKLLMDARDHICESPDGHGGVIAALGQNGLLERLERLGIRHIFVHNVDNCLVKVLDPAFIGYHIEKKADFSLKCLPKRAADETLGNVVKTSAGIRVIEYSDIPKNVAALVDDAGQLVFKTGSINIYLLRLDFMNRLYRGKKSLPYHFVRKHIPALDTSGAKHDSPEPNGIKLETKLFDVLQYTEKSSMLLTARGEEFSPLKSGQGQESYEAVLHDLHSLFSGWFEDAGIHLPFEKVEKIEISPLFAVDQVAFREKVARFGQAALKDLMERQIAETGQVRL